MNCIRCSHQDSEIAGECRKCHYVSMCLVVVHTHWPHHRRFEADKETELEMIHQRLRDRTVRDFIADSRANGAFLCLKLGNTIERLAHPAKIDPDELRRGVCEAISKYIGEINGVREMERVNNNPGHYMRRWTATVKSWVTKAAS